MAQHLSLGNTVDVPTVLINSYVTPTVAIHRASRFINSWWWWWWLLLLLLVVVVVHIKCIQQKHT